MTSIGNLLLDTHVFIWWRADPRRLDDSTRAAIAEAGLVFVSVASAWEAAIKTALGKLRLPEPFEAGVLDSGFQKLPITFSHAKRSGALPQHHRDPFDRMLVAQASSENLILVTHDQRIKPYDVEVLWA